jgi:3-hydroxyisobutyrate dehydrogenase
VIKKTIKEAIMTQKMIGVVGLGNMGQGMCQSLLRNGFKVIGTDLSVVQKERAQSLGVVVVDDLMSICQQTDTIILSLPLAKHVQQVVTGIDGILRYAQESTLILDTSTSEPEVTRSIAKIMSNLGHAFLDCPVSGGPAGAASGTMLMLVGGDESSLDLARPVLDALTSKLVHLGVSGNGNVAKLINNLLCASHLITTAEAMSLANKADLPKEALIEALNSGSGRSAISEVNYPKWILNEAFDSGFTMQLMRKDLRLATQLIESLDADVPLSKQVTSMWSSSESKLDDAEDFNCIVKLTGENL